MFGITKIRTRILQIIASSLDLAPERLRSVLISINADKPAEFGDLSCNAAMVLAKELNTNPMALAERIAEAINMTLAEVDRAVVAKPGFVNIFLTNETWQLLIAQGLALDLLTRPSQGSPLPENERKSVLIEFVSANPTGPLHLAHGRNAIIGDTLARVLTFLGHQVTREFYINDAGNQVWKLGASLKARCAAYLGQEMPFPEGGYQGNYLIPVAERCVTEFGPNVLEKPDEFFVDYAKEAMLKLIREDLDRYGVKFDRWVSEASLHADGSVDHVVNMLYEKDLAYEHDGALWFKSTMFEDDKDRVIKKADGDYTYIAPDLAYHKNKFDRNFDLYINVFGQDHHGYVQRLKATIKALGYDADRLQVVLYQLVRMKKGDAFVRMSKRAGNFESLHDIMDTVGPDVARFFYLNRKADTHLEFDLDVALKKSDENPVYYLQYAFVRTGSVLEKAATMPAFATAVQQGRTLLASEKAELDAADIAIMKKICQLPDILNSIGTSYHTHLLAVYALELSGQFHSFYNASRIIDEQNLERSQTRLALTQLVRNTLSLVLDLLGLSQPEKM